MIQAPKKNLHILQIIVKNTSDLDYSAPILWKTRALHHNARISILYCNINKKQYLRDSHFYSNFFRSIRAEEYDFSDSLRAPFSFFSYFIRKLLQRPYSDRSLRKYYVFFKLNPFRVFMPNGLLMLSKLFVDFMAHKIEKLIQRLVRPDKILNYLSPDIILLGNRTKTDFKGRKYFFNYLYTKKIPVVLLPHGVHQIHPFKEFIAFDEQGEKLPSFAEFWTSMRFEEPWINLPSFQNQFYNAGYPGLDPLWASYLQKDSPPKNVVLIILRKFLPKGTNRPNNFDPFTLDYNEMLSFLDSVGKAVSRCDTKPLKIIIKPHPSNDFSMLDDILQSKVKNYSISSEPIYALLPQTCIVISLFSTSLLIPISFKIPTIIVKTKLQDYVHQRWDKLENLYSKFNFYCSEPQKDLHKLLLEGLSPSDSLDVKLDQDYQHLFQFFKKDACNSSAQRIDFLIDQFQQTNH